MPRKTSQLTDSSAGAASASETTPLPTDLRPGAAVSPEVVNVFEEGVSPGGSLRLAPLRGRPAGEAIAVSVRAWIRNLAYDKDVWIDLCLTGPDGGILHADTLALQYQESAGGEGDFFTIGTAVPAPRPTAAEATGRALLYRLYGQISGQLFTDGILHRHDLPASVAAPTPGTATRTAAKPEAPKAAATTPKAAPKAAVKSTEKPAGKAAAAPKAPAKPKAAPKGAAGETAPATPRKRSTPKA